jgi:hypothetical protein
VVERYLNSLTIRLAAYEDDSAGRHLTDAETFTISVDGPLDLDQLGDDVRQHLGPTPRHIEQIYRETSWGAAGAGAELLVEISSILSGVGGLAALSDFVRTWVKKRDKDTIVPSLDAAEQARSFAAQLLNLSADGIQVTRVEPLADGHRVLLKTQNGTYKAEVLGDGIIRLKRRSHR